MKATIVETGEEIDIELVEGEIIVSSEDYTKMMRSSDLNIKNTEPIFTTTITLSK